MLSRDWFGLLIVSILCLIYFYLLSTPINLATADLGRHIKNGEQLLSGNVDVLYKNYYSYSYPDFPFVNHHWLGGVIFYIVSLVGGLLGVQILFICVNLGTLILFFGIAKKYSNVVIASIIALPVITVLAYRAEVRPEVFSYLFAGIYYLICKRLLGGEINESTISSRRWYLLASPLRNKKWLLALLILQLVWVNIHIYFFIGLFILSSFWLEAFALWFFSKSRESWNRLKDLTLIGLVCTLASVINPHFINGLIYPFTILGNYGYRVLENQSVFFLENIISVPTVLYFKIVLGLLVLSWIYKTYFWFKSRDEFSLAGLILSVAFSYLALTQIRNFALFGFFALPIIAINFKNIKLEMSKYLVFPALGIIFIFLLVINPQYWEARAFGLGLAPGIEKGAEFFTQENIKGPIFNNYDIGGYLIYYLYPKEKVFVDNRPEGYPVDFFTKVYVPMQEQETVWKEKSTEYGFNSIFFYRQDLTPWAQNFLLNRIKDPNWAPVFVDNYNIIFLKRNEQNKELVKKYELPKEMFKTN